MSKRNRWIIFNILLALVIGSTYYALFRPEAIAFQHMRNIISMPTVHITGKVMKIVNSYFCDFLWSYALTMALCLFEDDWKIIAGICLSLSFLIEYCQYKHLIAGTGDYFDLAVELVACTIALILSKAVGGKNNEV